jgi:TPR repeat protein
MRMLVLLVAAAVCVPASAEEDAKGNRPAAEAPPAPAPAPAPDVDPSRFGAKPADPAYGAFQRGLYITALNLALPRAKGGDPAAQTLVAEIYSRGLGVARNAPEAAKWYAEAAGQGVPEAQFQYALMLIDGRHVEKDGERAYDLMRAAADAGNRLAQFNLAQMIVTRESGPSGLEKAVSYYEKSARAGLADAQYAMAQAYANGAGGKPLDEAEARRWLLLAARQNYDTAQLDLGTWLIQGRGGNRNEQAGFAWLKRAAESGNVAAQNRLAKLYRSAIGNQGDPILAAAWYFIARRAGLKDPEMEDYLGGLTEAQTKEALETANRIR